MMGIYLKFRGKGIVKDCNLAPKAITKHYPTSHLKGILLLKMEGCHSVLRRMFSTVEGYH